MFFLQSRYQRILARQRMYTSTPIPLVHSDKAKQVNQASQSFEGYLSPFYVLNKMLKERKSKTQKGASVNLVPNYAQEMGKLQSQEIMPIKTQRVIAYQSMTSLQKFLSIFPWHVKLFRIRWAAAKEISANESAIEHACKYAQKVSQFWVLTPEIKIKPIVPVRELRFGDRILPRSEVHIEKSEVSAKRACK